jgi:hypothetical protein
MKKVIFFVSLSILTIALSSCATTASGDSEETGKVFMRIYEKHRSGLLLDGAQKYTVKRGDKLVNIARKQYGNEYPYFFPLIMIASTDVVSNPNLIKPGYVLTIPDLQRNMTDPNARKNLKALMEEFAPHWYGPRVRKIDRAGILEAAATL